MTRRDLVDLVLLGALWGASFLFMRMGAADFGPVALAFLRVAGASLLLVPLLLWRGEWPALRRHWRVIGMLGIVNSALPFLLFSVAALALSAALMAIFNATTPIWTALLAVLWMRLGMSPLRWLGLAIGLAGVVGLSWDRADFKAGSLGLSPAWGIAACLGAALLYGIGANLARKRLGGVPPMAVATGSQLSATLALLLPAWSMWPGVHPSPAAWASVAALAFVCTGLAYVLFFRLIAHAGASNAVTVTFLIPAFATLWGWWLLDEAPTPSMLIGCAVVLLGSALATGMVGGRTEPASTPVPRA